MIPEEQTCIGDLNGDFAVDVLDLLILLGAWGSCPTQGCCLADLNNTGTVDVQDLLARLVAWGPCPDMDTIPVKTLSEALDDAGLTQQQWDDYQAIMTGSASQRTKDNWTCWMQNYLMQCVNCPTCPGIDPFAN